jgi:outer membrane protein insertion porin family
MLPMTRIPARRLLALALASAIAGPTLAQQAVGECRLRHPHRPRRHWHPHDAAVAQHLHRGDIRDGLQHIGAGTVFTTCRSGAATSSARPRSPGDPRAVRPTSSEFVDVSRRDDILVVTVTERPAINKLTLTGNKDIRNEDLWKGPDRRRRRLAEGETFDRRASTAPPGLTRQYNRGKLQRQRSPRPSPSSTAIASTSRSPSRARRGSATST